MLIKKEKKGNLMVYHVGKNISDEKMYTIANTYVKSSDIDLIIDHYADVYTEDGKLLLKFRKGVLHLLTFQMPIFIVHNYLYNNNKQNNNLDFYKK